MLSVQAPHPHECPVVLHQQGREDLGRQLAEIANPQPHSLMKNNTNLRHGLLFLVLTASVFAVGLLPAQEAASEPKGKYTPGITQSRTYFFKAADKEMPYSIYVPKGYDKKKSYPLMVALHGLGGSDRGMMRYRGLTQLAEKHSYIVVAPMGYSSRGWYGSRGQTSRRGNPRNLGELSEKDVLNVLAITRRELKVNPKRIYLMGHSMGGGGTWHIGMKYPDLWAGLAPIAPAAPRNINDLAKAKHIPVILVQGDRDWLVPVSGARRWTAKMKDLKMHHSYIEVKGGGHSDVAWKNMPQIFEFFNKHEKGLAAAKEEDSKETAKPTPTNPPKENTKLPAITPGRTQSRTYFFKEAGKEMRYSLFVPRGYDKSKKYPLMVALHGLGSSDSGIMRYPGLTRLAQRHGYIVVAPMGYNERGWYGSRGQTSRRSNPRNLGELSEKDVMNVLSVVRKEFAIDNDRIYLMGHSMGGGGTWHLGMKYPDIWAALAPVAPAPPRNINDLPKIKNLPVIVVCGDQDGLVRLARVWVARMKALEMTHKYVEVKGGDHIRPAFQKLPDIFDFFNKHTKAPPAIKKNPELLND